VSEGGWVLATLMFVGALMFVVGFGIGTGSVHDDIKRGWVEVGNALYTTDFVGDCPADNPAEVCK
jgi:hypothetical protein